MSLLIERPWIALFAGLGLMIAALLARSRTGQICAGTWLAYGAYEYAVKARLLCSGECNIRVDLLVLYPVLALATLMGLVAVSHGAWRRIFR